MNNSFSFFRLVCALLVAQSFFPLAYGQAPLAPLPPLDSLPAEQLASLASQLFIQAKNLEAKYAAAARSQERERTIQEENLKFIRQDTSIEKAILDSLVVHLKAARAAEREAAAQWKKAQKAATFCEKTAVMEPLEQRKNLPKAWKQVEGLEQGTPVSRSKSEERNSEVAKPEAGEQKKSLRDKLKRGKEEENPPAADVANTVAAPPADTAQAINRKAVKKNDAPALPAFANYDPALDVMLNPPAPPCVLALNARDEFTGAILRQTPAGEIFRQTNPALRAYLEGKNQIVCSASIATAGQSASLWLTFQINDPNTRRAFGSLNKNSLALLTFTDGTALNLNNLRSDDGVADPETRLVTYRAQYALDAAALRKIRSTELDRLRIAWGTGYEDYDVQQVDALMRQAKCVAGE